MSDPHENLLEETTKTPTWLPVTGLVLFFAATVWIVLEARSAPDVTLPAPSAAAADAGATADSN